MQPVYCGRVTAGGRAYLIEDDPAGDCLLVSAFDAGGDWPVCDVTGKDRHGPHELVMHGGEQVPDDNTRRTLIARAVDAYRMWLLRDPLRPAP